MNFPYDALIQKSNQSPVAKTEIPKTAVMIPAPALSPASICKGDKLVGFV